MLMQALMKAVPDKAALLTRAISSGCPMRPSGVPAIIAFSKSLTMMPAL